MSYRQAAFSDISDTMIKDESQLVELKFDDQINRKRTVIHMTRAEYEKTFKGKGTTRNLQGRPPSSR